MSNDIEWKMVKLISVESKSATKGTTPTSIGYSFEKQGINFIKIESISDNGFFLNDKFAYISEACNNALKRSQLQENDILFSIAGALGRVAIVEKDMLPANTNQALSIIRLNTELVDVSFISFILKSSFIENQIEENKKGNAQQNLSLTQIDNLLIPVPYKNGEPDLETQELIAQKLSDMDSLIAAKEKLLAKKRDLKIGAMQKLIKQEESNNWRKVKLINCGVFSKGKGIPKSESNTGTIPAVRYGELYTKHENYIKNFYSFISRFVAESSHRLNQGDILFTASGETKEDIGKCVAFVDKFEAYAGGDLIILSPFENYDSKFLGLTLNSDYIKKQKAEVAQGDAIVHIRTAALQNLNVIIPFTSENKPNLKEQKRIASILTDMDIDIASIENELVKLRNLKTAMMQKMFCFKEVVE